jgi:hypothetical protein
MQIQSSRFKFLSAALALALAVSPEMLAQQTSGQSPASEAGSAQCVNLTWGKPVSELCTMDALSAYVTAVEVR